MRKSERLTLRHFKTNHSNGLLKVSIKCKPRVLLAHIVAIGWLSNSCRILVTPKNVRKKITDRSKDVILLLGSQRWEEAQRLSGTSACFNYPRLCAVYIKTPHFVCVSIDKCASKKNCNMSDTTSQYALVIRNLQVFSQVFIFVRFCNFLSQENFFLTPCTRVMPFFFLTKGGRGRRWTSNLLG